MSTWDELAAAETLRRGRYELWDNSTRKSFRAGAAWQREQLLADEALERAARALNDAGWTCIGGTHEPGCDDDCPYCRGLSLRMARTALTAALGDKS